MRIAASQLRVQGCLALTHMSNGEKRHFETDQGINQSQRHVFGISIRSDYMSVMLNAGRKGAPTMFNDSSRSQ
jgi:hypothetical protein